MQLHPIIEQILSPPAPRNTLLEDPEESKQISIPLSHLDHSESDTLTPPLGDIFNLKMFLTRSGSSIKEESQVEVKSEEKKEKSEVLDENGIPIPPQAPPIEQYNAFEGLVYQNQLQSRKVVSYIGDNNTVSPAITRYVQYVQSNVDIIQGTRCQCSKSLLCSLRTSQ